LSLITYKRYTLNKVCFVLLYRIYNRAYVTNKLTPTLTRGDERESNKTWFITFKAVFMFFKFVTIIIMAISDIICVMCNKILR